jgi:hypothetical protein
MTTTPTFSGEVRDGKLYFHNSGMVKTYLASIAGEVDITIAKHRKSRSERENRYYWGVVIPILQMHIGEENKEVVHEWVQIAVGHVQMMPVGIQVPFGTKNLTTEEFEAYATKVRMWASKELGVYIPLPNEGITQLSNKL